jgi:hypothetical protein
MLVVVLSFWLLRQGDDRCHGFGVVLKCRTFLPQPAEANGAMPKEGTETVLIYISRES